VDDFVARTFNGATVLQIGIAFATLFAMAWVFWIGARNSNRPPRPPSDAPAGDATP
jgi:hypothetical protein